MKLAQVKTAIEIVPKGANIVLSWDRRAKTYKVVHHEVRKLVTMVGRIGIDYDKQGIVQEKRANGELPAKNAGLPWGEWAIFPFLIVHNGNYYLRMYKGTSKTTHPSVDWLLDGQPATKEEVAPFLLASEFAEKTGDAFTVKIEDVISIHHEIADEIVTAIPEETEGNDVRNTVTYVDPRTIDWSELNF